MSYQHVMRASHHASAPDPASTAVLTTVAAQGTMRCMSDRKYRQRGYQDEPRQPAPRREKVAPEPKAPGRPLQSESGPKTPNLMGAHEVFRCARCGNRLATPVDSDTRCSRCGVDVH